MAHNKPKEGKIVYDESRPGTFTIERQEQENRDQAMRFNEGKPKLSYLLLGEEALYGEAKLWEAGAEKYARGNWLKGAPYTEVSDSLLRHLTKFLNGEDIDPETGEPHVSAIMTNAKMLAYSFHNKPEFDDRIG